MQKEKGRPTFAARDRGGELPISAAAETRQRAPLPMGPPNASPEIQQMVLLPLPVLSSLLLLLLLLLMGAAAERSRSLHFKGLQIKWGQSLRSLQRRRSCSAAASEKKGNSSDRGGGRPCGGPFGAPPGGVPGEVMAK